jgi:hypothetical protein
MFISGFFFFKLKYTQGFLYSFDLNISSETFVLLMAYRFFILIQESICIIFKALLFILRKLSLIDHNHSLFYSNKVIVLLNSWSNLYMFFLLKASLNRFLIYISMIFLIVAHRIHQNIVLLTVIYSLNKLV